MSAKLLGNGEKKIKITVTVKPLKRPMLTKLYYGMSFTAAEDFELHLSSKRIFSPFI